MKNKILYGGALLLLFAVSAGGSWLFYWSAPDWQANADSAATGVDENGYPWIGAKNPKMVIHEYLDFYCPHCPGAHKVLRSAIARHLDEIRLVRHDYARSMCAIRTGNDLTMMCPLVRAAGCAAKHVPYWKWNDSVMAEPIHELKLDPPSYIQRMVKQNGIPSKAFSECYDSESMADKAQKIYEETKAAGVSATPTYIIDGQVYSLKGALDVIKERF
ncbi:MAG: thioredoxin domain-containing protein [Deltaproteobacteria bacterium]|nr:thioredoxin domain-containing protein [Deltaproteobacteria bacterium]